MYMYTSKITTYAYLQIWDHRNFRGKCIKTFGSVLMNYMYMYMYVHTSRLYTILFTYNLHVRMCSMCQESFPFQPPSQQCPPRQ